MVIHHYNNLQVVVLVIVLTSTYIGWQIKHLILYFQAYFLLHAANFSFTSYIIFLFLLLITEEKLSGLLGEMEKFMESETALSFQGRDQSKRTFLRKNYGQ